MTTTQIRFLLIVEDDVFTKDQTSLDEKIKQLFIQFHRIYVEYILNPFSPIMAGGPIRSQRFDHKVNEYVQQYHSTL
jgi:menaquinone-dependent protoporphyrinogen IX oxidase